VLCPGIFGVPLDECAQSMYRAIKAVANEVSNLSLREVHLVNIDPPTTQFIQSVFYQLISSDDDSSTMSTNPPSAVAEPQRPSSGRDKSPSSGRGKDEGHEELFDDLLPENVQTSTLETSPSGSTTSGEEVMEDPCDDQQDEKILDREQTEEQESLVEQSQRLSSEVPGDMESYGDAIAQEQKSHANSQSLVDQDEKKSANKVPVTEKVLSGQDQDKQSFHVKISEDEEKSLANSEPLVDQEDETSTNKVIPNEVLNPTEVSQTLERSSGVNHLETGEMAGYEEHHHLSSKLEPQPEVFMQDFSLEDYHEDTPASLHREPTPEVPSDLPEDASRRPENTVKPDEEEHSRDDYDEGFYREDTPALSLHREPTPEVPNSDLPEDASRRPENPLKPDEEEHSRDDHDHFYPFPDDTADQADYQQTGH